MYNNNRLPSENLSIVERFNLNEQALNLFIKRDDLIHPIISGNKWRKLKYNILHLNMNRMEGILTFGGAYSNHLLATAFAAKQANIPCVGIIRGEELTKDSNLILSFCHTLGMRLKFVSRNEYGYRDEPIYKQELLTEYKNFWMVPEGGGNYQGVLGCMEIMKETENDYDFVCVSQGTTTTSIGILLSLPEKSKLLVCPALKGFDSICEMKQMLFYMGFEHEFIEEKLNQVIVLSTDELGKYGKASPELKLFNNSLYERMKINFDYTYNAKSLFQLNKYIERNSLVNEKILYIHTGGFS
jgi:1-aminocyclopropane-1-carboxylate deaminase